MGSNIKFINFQYVVGTQTPIQTAVNRTTILWSGVFQRLSAQHPHVKRLVCNQMISCLYRCRLISVEFDFDQIDSVCSREIALNQSNWSEMFKIWWLTTVN